MEVKLICHDALLLAQLMAQIARPYGAILVVVCSMQALIDLFRGRVTTPININGCMMCRVRILWDMPYGLDLEPWDQLLSDAEIETLFEQLSVINRARNHSFVLGAPWHKGARSRTCMLAKGYSDTC